METGHCMYARMDERKGIFFVEGDFDLLSDGEGEPFASIGAFTLFVHFKRLYVIMAYFNYIEIRWAAIQFIWDLGT